MEMGCQLRLQCNIRWNDSYRDAIRSSVAGFYGRLPVGENAGDLCLSEVSKFEKDGYRIENVLFDSFPSWQVNATVYVPTNFQPPFPAVVVPVGHSGKQFEDYQFPCQFFARAGYLAITFDPPGQAGEKRPGNDHFNDGVRCYVVGHTSSRYFIADALRCLDYLATRTDINMRTLSCDRSDELHKDWDTSTEAIRRHATELVNTGENTGIVPPAVTEPFRVWTHAWQQIVLYPEQDIELQGTLLYSLDADSTPTLIHFDDTGRHTLMTTHSMLMSAIRFLDTERKTFNLFSVDLRGWGDTAMALYPYELAGWGSVDRITSYMSAALGDHVMSMRIRDALFSLAYVRGRQECKHNGIVLSGSGLGAIVAMHVAAIDATVQGVVVWDGLTSLRDLIHQEQYDWPADTFMPNILQYYDLPELADSIQCPVHQFNQRDGSGKQAGSGKHLSSTGITDQLQALLNNLL